MWVSHIFSFFLAIPLSSQLSLAPRRFCFCCGCSTVFPFVFLCLSLCVSLHPVSHLLWIRSAQAFKRMNTWRQWKQNGNNTHTHTNTHSKECSGGARPTTSSDSLKALFLCEEDEGGGGKEWYGFFKHSFHFFFFFKELSQQQQQQQQPKKYIEKEAV